MIWIIIFNFLTKIGVYIEGIKRKKKLPVDKYKKSIKVGINFYFILKEC